MGVRLATLVTATLLGLVACGSDTSSAAMLAGTLQYGRVGGLAGDVDHLTIRKDGHADVSTRAGKRSFTLSTAEQARVKKAVVKADALNHVNIRRHAPVSDAYEYSLSYLRRTLEFDQTAIPPSVRDLVNALSTLVEKHGRH
jgi:hypothetical protein